MATRTAQLKLTVCYEYEDSNAVPDKDECHELLDRVIRNAANDGQLSGDGPLTVQSWSHTIDSFTTEELFPITHQLPNGNYIEYGPVWADSDGEVCAMKTLSDCPEEAQVFWSIYIRPKNGNPECVGDYVSREGCEDMVSLLV